VAVLLLVYTVGKVAFAAQGRLGLPTGPIVPAASHGSYFMDVATAQWTAAATGVLGAFLAIATVTPLAGWIPRTLMLPALAGMLLGVGGGAGIMIVDGFGGPGPGWHWYHGLVGTVAIGLLLSVVRSYAVRSGPGHGRAGVGCRDQ
jgi:hypothetical protein